MGSETIPEPRIERIEVTEKYRRQWRAHVERMAENGLPKGATHHRARGRRDVGRPVGSAVIRPLRPRPSR
jgi:hypothetical protein